MHGTGKGGKCSGLMCVRNDEISETAGLCMGLFGEEMDVFPKVGIHCSGYCLSIPSSLSYTISLIQCRFYCGEAFIACRSRN